MHGSSKRIAVRFFFMVLFSLIKMTIQLNLLSVKQWNNEVPQFTDFGKC